MNAAFFRNLTPDEKLQFMLHHDSPRLRRVGRVLETAERQREDEIAAEIKAAEDAYEATIRCLNEEWAQKLARKRGELEELLSKIRK